jgi:RNA polymerase sigma factor (TIGR02999 family)
MQQEEASTAFARGFPGATAGGVDRSASADALFVALYDELHRMARHEVWRRGGEAVGPTTLVHEAWLQISGRVLLFEDDGRFLAYAARTMRGLVIDHVRARQSLKRGSGKIEALSESLLEKQAEEPEELERIGDALDELEKTDQELARIVDLKFFCGFTFAEVAAMQGVTERTVQRQWRRARLLLFNAMASD